MRLSRDIMTEVYRGRGDLPDTLESVDINSNAVTDIHYYVRFYDPAGRDRNDM